MFIIKKDSWNYKLVSHKHWVQGIKSGDKALLKYIGEVSLALFGLVLILPIIVSFAIIAFMSLDHSSGVYSGHAFVTIVFLTLLIPVSLVMMIAVVDQFTNGDWKRVEIR